MLENNEITAPTIAPERILSESIMDMDAMYAAIGKTLSAMEHTTVDGRSSDDLDAELQANPNKQYIPSTELQMLHASAVPMSEADVKAEEEILALTTSTQYRQRKLTIPTMTLAETTGARVRIAYRLVRYMAHIRGIGQVGKPLIFSMGVSNPQIDLFSLPLPYNPMVGWHRGLSAVRNLLATSNESEYTYSYLIENRVLDARGMSILPPPIHDGYYPAGQAWKYRREQFVPADYKAVADAPLAIYLNIMELLVRHLGIAEVSIEEQAAVCALLNPKIARLAWPCRDDIETFEQYVLLPYIGRVCVKRSQANAIDALKEDMGLTHAEAFDLVEMYKTYAKEVDTYDPDMERSLIIAKLQDLAQECGDASMVTTQLNTYKTYLATLGLTTHEDDSNVDRRKALSSALEDRVRDSIEASDDAIIEAESEL